MKKLCDDCQVRQANSHDFLCVECRGNKLIRELEACTSQTEDLAQFMIRVHMMQKGVSVAR
jgi:hypothetical protein